MKDGSINFLLGAIVGGLGAYYILSHKDEIVNGLQELNDGLESGELAGAIKERVESFVQGVGSAVSKESLQAEIEALKAKLAELESPAVAP